MPGLGTLINVVAVALGSGLGILFGRRLTDELRRVALLGLGLATLLIGFGLALKAQHIVALIVAIAGGGILGHLLGFQRGLDRLGRWFEARLGGDDGRISRGFVTASLLFCVGPMTLIGCIQDGASGDYQTLAVKSMLDFFASMALASALGSGVMLSILTIIVYQGGLTLAALWLGNFMGPVYQTEIFAVGGLMIIAIGLELCDLRKSPTADYLPALVLSPIFVYLEQVLQAWMR